MNFVGILMGGQGGLPMSVRVNENGKNVLLKSGNIYEIARQLNKTAPEEAVAATLNGTLTDFSSTCDTGDDVKLFDFTDPLGKEVFWHSSAHVLAQAVLRLWPHAKPTIGPAIENGFFYDFANLTLSEEDFGRIEAEVKIILKQNFKIEKRSYKSKKELLKLFSHNPYKQELIEGFEGDNFTVYKQGEFFDLCKGPHIPSFNKIKSFKILKTSGAYWKGDVEREMLTRIYGISFPCRNMMKTYLAQLEEARKRDHKMLGKKLDLFTFHPESPGAVFMHPKGSIIWNKLVAFIKDICFNNGYIEIKTPTILTKDLWERSGHWEHYKENMYITEIEKREFAIKPMSCPGCMIYFNSSPRSYKELPMRVLEIGHVHRYEKSGALNGLFRVRSFHQDDAHIFVAKSHLASEIKDLLRLAKMIYDTFGLEIAVELSTRPEEINTIGSDADWNLATESLMEALNESAILYKINEGDGAFYGPKIDIHICDAIGRSWQCGTIQLDLALPKRFDISYTGADNALHRPFVLHRALFGSIERFLAILIEHFAGRLPLWLNPDPIHILPIAEDHELFCRKMVAQLKKNNIASQMIAPIDSLNKRVRNGQNAKVNYLLVVGDTEVEKNEVAVRFPNGKTVNIATEHFIATIVEEKRSKSFKTLFEN